MVSFIVLQVLKMATLTACISATVACIDMKPAPSKRLAKDLQKMCRSLLRQMTLSWRIWVTEFLLSCLFLFFFLFFYANGLLFNSSKTVIDIAWKLLVYIYLGIEQCCVKNRCVWFMTLTCRGQRLTFSVWSIHVSRLFINGFAFWFFYCIELAKI